jgi:D-psicose/D-tagatose/L-ribulose 3-epimerase
MKLAVSNIAWTNEEEFEIANLLRDLGVKYVEVAPTKLWQNPTNSSVQEIDNYVSFWKNFGIEIVAFQSMLFNRPDLKIFESKSNRQDTFDYLINFINLASKMAVGVMVFGSPKNRQKGEMKIDNVDQIATKFFKDLGDFAEKQSVKFCIEPNASQYACDFITNAHEGINFVRTVNKPGFGLHLDIACMSLAGDDIKQSIKDAKGILKHFHISSPMLDIVESRPDIQHEEAAMALREIDYDGYVSIEMRPGEVGSNIERVRKAVEYAQLVYGS